ncbi:GAL4 enhancer protein [Sorochytrium milnesiophthora]
MPKSNKKSQQKPVEEVEQPQQATIEEITNDEQVKVEEAPDSDDELGATAEAADAPALDGAALQQALRMQTRGEKKARKVFEGMGLKAVNGVNRVVFRRPRNELIIINNPEVFKSSTADVYIVYGEATVGNAGINPAAAAAAAAAGGGGGQFPGFGTTNDIRASNNDNEEAPELAEDDDDEEVDETGVDPKDIEMVTSQANVSRAKAVKAIKKNDGDIINAIMQLSL